MITHVAIRFQNKIYSLPAPNRHHHIIKEIVKQTGAQYVDAHDDDQGFLDEHNNYYNRQDALKHALDNNQVKNVNDIRAGLLFSEDLW